MQRAAGAVGRRWRPQKCMMGGVSGRVGLARHLAAGVDVLSLAERSAQRAQVGDVICRWYGSRFVNNPGACHECRMQDDAINGSILSHECGPFLVCGTIKNSVGVRFKPFLLDLTHQLLKILS